MGHLWLRTQVLLLIVSYGALMVLCLGLHIQDTLCRFMPIMVLTMCDNTWRSMLMSVGVNDLAFSHPNKQLCVVTCGDDKTIKVWDAATGTKQYTFEGHEAPIYYVCPHYKSWKNSPLRGKRRGVIVFTAC